MKKIFKLLIGTLLLCAGTTSLADNSVGVTFTDMNGNPISSLSSAGTFFVKITALGYWMKIKYSPATPVASNALPLGVTYTTAYTLASCLPPLAYPPGSSCIVEFTYLPQIPGTETLTVGAANIDASPVAGYTSQTITLQKN